MRNSRHVKRYDWSILDRQLLIKIALLSNNQVVGKRLSPKELTARIRRHLTLFKIPISVTSTYHSQTEKNCIWIGGCYNINKDRLSKTPITVRLQYNPLDEYIVLTLKKFQKICVAIADTILHEIIHMRQYRRRLFEAISGYNSTAGSYSQRLEQDYLGHPDEIDAYSFNIACLLRDKFGKDYKQILKYLAGDFPVKKLKRNPYSVYLETFDYNHDHPVIKKLKNKIMYYLQYAALGKPYKTNKWLKT
jgi:hypothetical protein